MQMLMERVRPGWSKSLKMMVGGLALLSTLAAVPVSSSAAQDYAQPYYYPQAYQPPPPPVVIVPPPVVRYEQSYDEGPSHWARRRWLRQQYFRHYHREHHHHRDHGHGHGHRR